jgi:hypothetical protein
MMMPVYFTAATLPRTVEPRPMRRSLKTIHLPLQHDQLLAQQHVLQYQLCSATREIHDGSDRQGDFRWLRPSTHACLKLLPTALHPRREP